MRINQMHHKTVRRIRASLSWSDLVDAARCNFCDMSIRWNFCSIGAAADKRCRHVMLAYPGPRCRNWDRDFDDMQTLLQGDSISSLMGHYDGVSHVCITFVYLLLPYFFNLSSTEMTSPSQHTLLMLRSPDTTTSDELVHHAGWQC